MLVCSPTGFERRFDFVAAERLSLALRSGRGERIRATTCRLLAANGAKVAVHGRDKTKISAVVDEICSNGGRAIGVSADVSDFAAIERMRERVEEELGIVEVLVAFQAQTRVLMRTLRRLNIPALIFVDKIERGGAKYENVLQDIEACQAGIGLASVGYYERARG